MSSTPRWTRDLRREVLPNGLTLLVQRDDSSAAAAVVTHVKAGFFDEPDRWTGVSHVLEHMYFKGTPARGPGAVARETKAAGGYLNAHTSYDHTAYFVVLPSDRLETALEIQSDALRNSLIDDEELARELAVIIQEARRKRDTPSAVAGETLHEVMFDRHRIRRWRIGTEEQLAGYTRADIHGYYASRYVPERTIVSIVGNVDPDAALELARARYAGWEPRTGADDPSPAEPPHTGVRARTLRGDVSLAELVLGWQAPDPLHADAPALDVAAAILSAGRGSWLYRRLREPGVVTSAVAHYYAPSEIGVFTVGADLEPEQVPEAVRGMAESVARLALSGPSAEELFRARTLLLARWARRMEPTEGRAMALASAEALDGVDFLDREYAALAAVTAEEVRAAAARWLRPDNVSGVAYLPEGRGRELTATALAEAFAVTALTPIAAQPPIQVQQGNGRSTGSRPRLTAPVAGVHHCALPGVDLLIRPKRGVPMVTLGAYHPTAPAASAEDAGLAALAIRSAVRGAGGLDAAALAFAFERLGGTLGTTLSSDWAGYTTTVLAENLGAAASLLSTVLTEPTLAAADVELERKNLQGEVEQVADDMLRYPMQHAFSAAFGNRGYGLPVSGTRESLAALTPGRVRDWHAGLRNGMRTTVIAVGDIDPDRAADDLARIFGSWPGASLRAPDRAQPWTGTPPVWVEQREKAQTALAMLFPGPHRRHERRHAAAVWAAVASGLGGRLFEALRDRRSLAYTVLAMSWQRGGAGALVTYIATAPEREAEAREQMLIELARFANEPVSDVELTRAVEYLAGQAQVQRQSAGSVLAEILAAWMIGDGLPELDDPAGALRRVTAEDVRAVAGEYLDPERRVEGIVRGFHD